MVGYIVDGGGGGGGGGLHDPSVSRNPQADGPGSDPPPPVAGLCRRPWKFCGYPVHGSKRRALSSAGGLHGILRVRR